MTTPHWPSSLIPVALMLLIVWRLYARMRRLVGQQRLHPMRARLTVLFFPAVIGLLMFGPLATTANNSALIAGALIGVGLGYLGLRLTRFEQKSGELFYTPNAHLGIALSALLAGRILYRFLMNFWLGVPSGAHDGANSPLTLLLLATLSGYYTAYAVGLLRWRRNLLTTVS